MCKFPPKISELSKCAISKSLSTRFKKTTKSFNKRVTLRVLLHRSVEICLSLMYDNGYTKVPRNDKLCLVNIFLCLLKFIYCTIQVLWNFLGPFLCSIFWMCCIKNWDTKNGGLGLNDSYLCLPIRNL